MQPGPEQMARDEALLVSGLERPLLRHYRWLGRWASFGYSQSLAQARMEAIGFDLVRRWTGGGVVLHDTDWTFSLLVPPHEPFFRVPPREAYCRIHAVLGGVLGESLEAPPRLAGDTDCARTASCFTGPSLHDIMDARSGKICGGAQRRTKLGMLHQGSIQNVNVPEGFAEAAAGEMARRVKQIRGMPSSLRERSRALAASRYGSREWTERIP